MHIDQVSSNQPNLFPTSTSIVVPDRAHACARSYAPVTGGLSRILQTCREEFNMCDNVGQCVTMCDKSEFDMCDNVGQCVTL